MEKVEYSLMFNHQKVGWEIQGIINLAQRLIHNKDADITMADKPFEFEDWGKVNQIRIHVSHGFVWEDREDGLPDQDGNVGMNVLKTKWIVYKWVMHEEGKKTFLSREIIETHDMQNEDFINWLWTRRNLLLVSEGEVGYSREKGKYLPYGTY